MKLKDLIGFIKEYQKADYKERIVDEIYNDLVEQADKLAVEKLNRKYNKTYNNFNL